MTKLPRHGRAGVLHPCGVYRHILRLARAALDDAPAANGVVGPEASRSPAHLPAVRDGRESDTYHRPSTPAAPGVDHGHHDDSDE